MSFQLAGGGRNARLVAYLTGGLLLVAAGLKLYGLNLTPYSQVGRLISPGLQAVGIAWELILALWLFSSPGRFASWIGAIVTFVAFAITSVYLIVVGQSECGCFGAVRASPWQTLMLDVTVLVALVWARPARPHSWAAAVSGTRWPVVAVSSLIVLAATFWAIFGTFSATVAWLRGDRVVTDYSYLDFGSGTPGQQLEVTLTVFNYGDHPIRLVGMFSQCSCLSTSDLPLAIAPRNRATVRLVLTVPQVSPGQTTRLVEIMTEDVTDRRLQLTAACRVE